MFRSSHSTRRVLANLASVVIPLWAIVLTLLCTSLMVGHWVSLPTPAVGSPLSDNSLNNASFNSTSLNDTALNSTAGAMENAAANFDNHSTSIALGVARRLHVSHFLYVDCPCSRKIFDYISQRQPLAGADERVVLIGRPNPQELESARANFAVEVTTPEALLETYGVESAPLLVVTDSRDIIQYAGGYTSRKRGLDYQDQAIVQQLQAGRRVDPLPLYGCAVSQRLKQIVDPIGLKY